MTGARLIDTELARALFERVRRDSGYQLSPARSAHLVGKIMGVSAWRVAEAVGWAKIAECEAPRE
jgi:hypothetical protein